MVETNNSVDNSLKNYMGRILDLISDGIYISDRSGRTLRINSMYERLTGLKRTSLVGRNVDALTSEYNFDTILNPQIVKSGKPATKVQTDSRGKKLVLNGFPILDDDGEVVLVVTFVRDVTLMAQLREQIRAQRKLIEKYRTNVQYINEDADQKRPLIAHSSVMVALNQRIESVADTDATVLLQGETGVGKDVVAQRIHQNSSRKGKPFVKVDCPTIPESLFESELFGYAPGAFSGAHVKGKLGLLEMADKGTLFLDEIGELPLTMQAKLLRVLQDREFLRVGATTVRKVDVRVVSATNRDLEKAVREGRFRSDLFYRLRVAVLTLPPLRDRQADITPFANHFLSRYTSRYQKKLVFDSATLAAFSEYHWPGNIREIENLIQSLVITSHNGSIRLSDLPSNMVGRLAETCRKNVSMIAGEAAPIDSELLFPHLPNELDRGDRSLKAIMGDIERQILRYALKKQGSHAKVAKRFKIDRSTLFRKLKTKDSTGSSRK